MASQSASSANPVPGLSAVSADDVEAVVDSGVAPTPNMDTVLLDFTVGRRLAVQSTVGWRSRLWFHTRYRTVRCRVRSRTRSRYRRRATPVTDQQGQFSAEPTNPGAITHTGTTTDATQSANSTQQGFEGAAATFHGNRELPQALIEGALSPGPDNEAEMPEDGDHQDHTAMDASNTQMDTKRPSTSANQQPANLGATGQPIPAITFDPEVIANLVQAASAGQFWDAPGPLRGATADHMQELHAVLQKMAANQKPAETDPDKGESGLEGEVIRVCRTSESASTSTDSSSSSSSNSDSDTASDPDSHKSTTQKKMKRKKTSAKRDKDLLGQEEADVFIVSKGSEDECGSNKDDESCLPWATQVNDEPEWIVRYPNAIPYVHSRVESTDDGWYHGEDCASPSEVAYPGKSAILPATDGSLALKADAVLPSASPGCSKYGDQILDRQVYHNKAKRKATRTWTQFPKPS